MQDLIDKAQRILVENRNLLQRMQASVGIPLTGEDDAAFTNFKQVSVCVFLCVCLLVFLYYYCCCFFFDKIIVVVCCCCYFKRFSASMSLNR